MKLLFDAQLSFKLVKKLSAPFPNSLHVSQTGMPQPASDIAIWQFARNHDFTIVTYDEDYYDFLNLYGSPPKVVWLRFGNASTNFVAQKLIEHTISIYHLESNSEHDLLEIY